MIHLFNVLLALHIIGGFVGLLAGTINLVRIKGDKRHRLTGKIFTYGMLTAGFTSLALAILHPNIFLLMVGVFTIYLVGTGNRYIYKRMPGGDQRPSALDWTITIGMLVAGVLFILLGIKYLFARSFFGIVLLVFGAIGLAFVKTDFANYKGRGSEGNNWLLAHLQRMTAGYIAALTAFLVVNVNYLPVAMPDVVAWLLPTALLTPLIVKWSRRYQVK